MSHLSQTSNITMRVNSQFPQPDLHRQDMRPYGLQTKATKGNQNGHQVSFVFFVSFVVKLIFGYGSISTTPGAPTSPEISTGTGKNLRSTSALVSRCCVTREVVSSELPEARARGKMSWSAR